MLGSALVVPTGIEAAALKALEKSLATAVTQVGKRLWGRFSPAAKRERIATDALRQLTSQDFSDQLRLSVLLPALPTGVSLARVKTGLGSVVYQGIMQELVAARIMDMPAQVVLQVRENMQIATRLEFAPAGANPAEMMDFGGILFDELDRVVRELVLKLDGSQVNGLSELRQSASLALLSASIDGINRHHSYLKKQGNIVDLASLADWEATYRAQVMAGHGYIEPPDFERKRKVPIESLFVSPQIKSRDDDTSAVTNAWALHTAIDRTVLLGDPGGGKSTASNAIAWRAAADTAGPVPFVIVLRVIQRTR